MTPIKRAAVILRSQKALADAIGVTPAFISQMISGTAQIPAGRCFAIQRATKGQVTMSELRPDIFGEDTEAA